MRRSRVTRVVIVPAGVVLSTMFGGGYASGREVVTFVSSHGPWGGVLAALTIAVVFGAALSLCIELARMYRVYEHGSFARLLLGRASVIYEIALHLGLFLILAVAATFAGAMLERHFGIPQIVGTALLVAGTIALTYLGRRAVERSMVVTAGLLVLLLGGLLIVVFASSADVALDAFASDSADPTFWQGGLRYAVLGAAFIPLILFVARGVETRTESLVSGMAGGAMTALPALVFHLVFMASYPAILDEEVATYVVAETYGGGLFLDAFVIVAFLLVVQTAVGGVQGLIERFDVAAVSRRGRLLRPAEHATISTGVLVGTVVLSMAGLATLVATGYGLLSLVFVLVFAIPLFTIGVRKIWRPAVAPGAAGPADPS